VQRALDKLLKIDEDLVCVPLSSSFNLQKCGKVEGTNRELKRFMLLVMRALPWQRISAFCIKLYQHCFDNFGDNPRFIWATIYLVSVVKMYFFKHVLFFYESCL